MRAYLRIDPLLSQNKKGYPDGALAAFITLLCEAEQQPERGIFRNMALLKVLLERRKRWVPYMIAHGDLVVLPDGRLYVEGWKEWQEGDWQVAERMRRVRERQKHRNADRNGSDGADRNGTVIAVSGKHLAVGSSAESDGVLVAHG